MAARFILSFDCEGKWGVADCLSRREHRWLSNDRLRAAYSSVVELLDDYDMPATFAFVGLFGESEESFGKLLLQVEELARQAPDYLGPALADIKQGSREGWHGAWAVEAVGQARAGHEIALHGVTHVPWTSAGPEFFARELALVGHLSGPVASSRTFVFPRNLEAHLQLLSSASIEGFRRAPPKRSRAARFLSEFAIWARPEADLPLIPGLPVPIPGGFFVNWRRGLRGLIPESVSRLRIQRLLDRAARSGELVHLWLHPENIASAPRTLDLLRSLVEIVARERDSGRCVAMTQIEYARQRRSEAKAASL